MKIWNGTDYTEYPGTPYATAADLDADEAALAAHLADTADAHDASAISVLDVAGDFTATDVEAALAELQGDHETDEAALAAHIADSSDAHDASAVSIADAGGFFTGTDVEAALQELRASGPVHVAITPGGNLDVTSGTMVAWSGTAALTVPTWATTAKVLTTVAGAYGAAGNVVADVQVRIGAVDGARVVQEALPNNTRTSISWSDQITLGATGASTIEVRALRASGSVAVRADASSDFTFLVWFS